MTSQADYNLIKNGFMMKARTLKKYFQYDYQVTDDETDVNRGGVHWIITRPGAAPITPWPGEKSKKFYQVNWNLVFDMQIKYKNYKTSWNQFGEMRDAVFNLFVFTLDKSLPDPTSEEGALIKGIWDIAITAPDIPGQKPPAGAPTWIGQQLIAIITQRIDLV